MNIFGDYARYCNVLYQDKEYAAETEFILDCLKRHGGMHATLLDLGCGTGRPALEMGRQGSLTAAAAGRRCTYRASRQTLRCGDQPVPCDELPELRRRCLTVMETARQHLKPSGLFLFDF